MPRGLPNLFRYDGPQCSAHMRKSNGKKCTIWFCLLPDGHVGEHRSYRKRWPQGPHELPGNAAEAEREIAGLEQP
jgi:hypothetical protein